MARLIVSLLLIACAGSGAAAETSPVSPISLVPLDSLLGAHADSMGLSRLQLDERCWHLVEEINALGLIGRAETWAQAPASVHSKMELGPLTIQTWFDGEKGWISDRNGAFREAAGPELEGMLVSALFSTGAWLLQNPPVPLSFDIDADASTDSTFVITCEPLFEKPLHIELRRDTLLPVGTLFSGSSGDQRSSFLEWGWYDGVRVTMASKVELAGLLTIHSSVLEIERGEARPIEFFRPPAGSGQSTPDDLQFPGAVVSAPLIEDGLHLLVQGFISDAAGEETPAVLLVDTGAGANFLDAGVAERLGLESTGVVPTLGVGGHAESSFVTVSAVRIGELRLLEQSWMASDFSAIRSWFEHPPSAVLGYDFLSRTVLEVDYAAREIRLHDPRTFQAPVGAIAVPLRMDANVPSIEASIEGNSGWLHVDTGSNSSLDLASPFVLRHEMLEGRETTAAGGLSGVGGTANSQRGRIATLEFGKITLTDVETGFNSSAETGIFSRDDIAGILGAELLSKYHCWFDYPGRTLWLTTPTP